jgi:hypothetical protein
VSAIDSEFRFDRDTLQGFGHPVLFCHGPGGGECPLLAEDACPLVEEAHGVIFELDLDVPVHREILLRYQQILAEDIPIRLLVKPGQIERYPELVAGVDKVWTEPPGAAELDAFAAGVDAYDRTVG